LQKKRRFPARENANYLHFLPIYVKMYLKPGKRDEYKRRHANLFPELRRLLSESGVRNYSIYLDEETNTLYAYQDIEGLKRA